MITSKSNQYIKLFNELQRKKYRQEYGLFPAEGRRLIEDLVDTGLRPHLILYSNDFGDIAFLEKVCPCSDNCFAVDDNIFQKISATKSSQGIAAAFPMMCPELSSLQCAAGDLVLILNKIQDPGNLGTIIRTAAAAGIKAVIMEEGTVDPYNPKVVRSTMGAIGTIPLFYDLPFESISEYLQANFYRVFLCDMAGDMPYWEIPLDRCLAVVLGNEGSGLSGDWLNGPYGKIYIPQTNKVESLNVAMAGGIIAFDFRRRCLK